MTLRDLLQGHSRSTIAHLNMVHISLRIDSSGEMKVKGSLLSVTIE